jgi:aspartyl protease family protein
MRRIAGILAGVSFGLLAAEVDATEILVMALFRDKAMVRIDGVRRILEVGEVSAEGVKLVAADAHRAVIDVDGRTATYRLGREFSTRFAASDASHAEARLVLDRMGMYSVTGAINGFPVPMTVDTGAATVAMSEERARQLGIDFRRKGERGKVSTASGVADAYFFTLDRVQVGGIELRQVAATIVAGKYPLDVLLGMSFLGRLEMERDGAMLVLRHPR